ncbi:unnamed protein product [Hapterophycus canaliculatus]
MNACKLCGFRGSGDAQSKCPVCDEPYEPLHASGQHEQQDEVVVPGSQLAQAASGAWCGMAQQKLQTGAQALAEFSSPGRTVTHLNLELQSLLGMIPAQQLRRKRAEDVVRAVGGGWISARADGQCDPGVVYIRPRADPTMTVLKGRYKTHPRAAKSASMSALHRLAHPLIGYDSMEALPPKIRRKRQESIERQILGEALPGSKTTRGASQSVRQGRRCKRAHSSTGPSSRSSGRSLPRKTPMAMSVNAVNLADRTRSVRAPASQPKWQQKRHARRNDGRPRTREMAVSPRLRLRASEGRRAKPILRRKRVATMRSVDGWIRETDAVYARRPMSLDRRIVALKQKGDLQRKETHPLADSRGADTHDKHLGGGSATFLTELETDGAVHVAEIYHSHGNGTTSSCPGNIDRQWRGKHELVNRGRQHQGREAKDSTSVMAKREHPRRRSSGAVRVPCSTLNGKIRPSEPGVTKARSGRSEVARFGILRNKSVRTVNRPSRQGRKRGDRTPVVNGNGTADRGQEAVSPIMQGEMEQTMLVSISQPLASLCNQYFSIFPADFNRKRSTPSPTVAFHSLNKPRAHERFAQTTRAWQGGGAGARTPSGPCSDWRFLRDGGGMPSSRSAELLRSFENKVASPCPVGRRRRRPTAVREQEEEHAKDLQENGPLEEKRQGPHSAPSREGGGGGGGGAPSSPSGSRLASMHKRPGSKSWVHRRSLPSLLLSDQSAEEQPGSRGQRSATPPLSRASPGAAGRLQLRRKRGKWRAAPDKPSGRMQRLDKTPPVTVGDAWGGGLFSRGGTGEGDRSRESTCLGDATRPGVDRFQLNRGGRAASPSLVKCGTDSNGNAGFGTVAAGGGASVGASASSGKLLLLGAVSEPLLCVGSGGGFQLRS